MTLREKETKNPRIPDRPFFAADAYPCTISLLLGSIFCGVQDNLCILTDLLDEAV